ncbi:MAG: class IV adenylate cyclase [Planctomycetota bacterium]|nr:class IV adenylate cyclase [Planctomycetota bacterium]MDA1248510.1 class IV adenylate cyclase [Planctomycetota bacterium]
MSETFEVEVKFFLSDRVAMVLAKLQQLGAISGADAVQADHYFNHPVRDFAQTDEALRIRSVGDQNWVTWKGPKIGSRTKTRREIELPLGDGTQTAEQLSEVLQILGFRSVTVVRKTRKLHELTRNGRRFEIALDEVDELGTFLEVELMADEADLKSAQDAVLELARELGLSQTEPRSYLGMLLQKRGEASGE